MHANPPLARAVRTLEIVGTACGPVGGTWECVLATGALPGEDDAMGDQHTPWAKCADQPCAAVAWDALQQLTTHTLPALRDLTLDSLDISLPPSSHDAHLPLASLTLRRVGTSANTNRALLRLLDAFDASRLVLDCLPFRPGDPNTHHLRRGKRTTALELCGEPDAAFLMHVLRAAPFARNVTRLGVHVSHADDVAALGTLLRAVGRSLRELSIDLRPVCYVSKPEVYLDHDTYVALILNFTLFPCLALRTFTLSLDVSFDYTGSSNALDCAPQVLATLPPSVSSVTLNMNFVYVVQATAVGLNWTGVHRALSACKRQLRHGVRFVVSNQGVPIPVEERKGVVALFEGRFHMIKDILRVEFAP